MINRLIDVALKNRFIVVVLYLGLAGWGWWALTSTPIDAIPDLSDNQVIVFTDWPGHSPQEVEDQVTYPLTTNLQGLAGVRVVRSQSAFGFSMIYVVFEDNVELYFARTRVLERMSLVTKSLPTGVTPTLGPDATGVGHVFWYTVESPTHSLRELRTLQDWFIRYQLNAVPGVAEVASVGGHVQQYQVDVDPNRLQDLQPAAQRGGVGRPRQQPECRRQRARVERRLADRARRRVDRVRRRHQADRRRRRERRPDLRRAGGERPDRRRLPRRLARERDAGSRRRRRRRADRRQHEGRHRRGQGAHRADCAGPPAGRHDRAVLRPLGLDRAGGRHVAHGADRGDRARDAGARHLPDALPVDPDRHPSAAARRPDVVPGHVLRRDLLQHHEPRRHRHRDWRARGRGHRRDGERVPIRRAARGRRHAIAAESGRPFGTPRDWSDGPCSSRWRSSCSPSFRCSR